MIKTKFKMILLDHWGKAIKINFNRSIPNFQALTTYNYKIRSQLILPLNLEVTMDPADSIERNYWKVLQIVLQVCCCFSSMTTSYYHTPTTT